MYPSKAFLASTRSLTFLSSSANCSASLIIFSICSSVRRPLSLVMVIFSLFPVPLSSAPTFKCRWNQSRKSPQSGADHEELEGFHQARTCREGDCLWSLDAHPRKPGCLRQAGCL